jgi:hypothetical protein
MNPRRKGVIVGENGAAIAQGAEIFGGIKTKAGKVAKATRLLVFALCAMGLRAIFDNRYARRGGKGDNFSHIGKLAVKMRDQYRCDVCVKQRRDSCHRRQAGLCRCRPGDIDVMPQGVGGAA